MVLNVSYALASIVFFALFTLVIKSVLCHMQLSLHAVYLYLNLQNFVETNVNRGVEHGDLFNGSDSKPGNRSNSFPDGPAADR